MQTDIKHLATLASITIDQQQLSQLTEDIQAIMQFVRQLESVDTNNISPLQHPLNTSQPLRADIPNNQDCSAELAAIAPHFVDNLYLVPKVIDLGK